MKPTSDIGVIGLGTMGASIARNIASRGFFVSVYNRSSEKTDAFMDVHGVEGFIAAKTMKAFVASIKTPRKIMIMIKSGGPVDAVIASLLPHLDKGDIIVDGGNSFYKDTQRRFEELKKKYIQYIGCGVSGGEEGALCGPSLMPGGSKRAWRATKKIFEAVAARDFSGNPCVTYVGDNAAGHYAKMVHNGIEYAIMQLMAETYALYRTVYGLEADEIAKIFAKYNKGKLHSFLFEIVVPVLSKKSEKKGECCLIYSILDKAGSKGTGKWTAIDALDRGVATPSIFAAVSARALSRQKEKRKQFEKLYPHTHPKLPISLTQFKKITEDALYAASISIFAQGFDLLRVAAKEETWDIDLAEISRIWQGGCIIRTKLLEKIHSAYSGRRTPEHLFAASTMQKQLKLHIPKLRRLVAEATKTGVALPAFASALYYFESMTEARLPAHVIQGLRDYFGAHTYERIDMKGRFHTEWDE